MLTKTQNMVSPHITPPHLFLTKFGLVAASNWTTVAPLATWRQVLLLYQDRRALGMWCGVCLPMYDKPSWKHVSGLIVPFNFSPFQCLSMSLLYQIPDNQSYQGMSHLVFGIDHGLSFMGMINYSSLGGKGRGTLHYSLLLCLGYSTILKSPDSYK